MDFDTLGSQFFCNCFLLLIEITELFFPHLDFAENSFDIILRIAHIFSNFQHLTQVHDNFFGLKFVGSRDQTAHILRFYRLHRSRMYFAWWSLLLRRSERSNTSGLHATSSGINVIPRRWNGLLDCWTQSWGRILSRECGIWSFKRRVSRSFKGHHGTRLSGHLRSIELFKECDLLLPIHFFDGLWIRLFVVINRDIQIVCRRHRFNPQMVSLWLKDNWWDIWSKWLKEFGIYLWSNRWILQGFAVKFHIWRNNDCRLFFSGSNVCFFPLIHIGWKFWSSGFFLAAHL